MSDQQEGRKPPKPAELVRPQGVVVPTVREHKWDENYVCEREVGVDMAEPGKTDKTVIKYKCKECGADLEITLSAPKVLPTISEMSGLLSGEQCKAIKDELNEPPVSALRERLGKLGEKWIAQSLVARRRNNELGDTLRKCADELAAAQREAE